MQSVAMNAEGNGEQSQTATEGGSPARLEASSPS